MTDLRIFASHPVQYHAPFWRELDKNNLDIEVLYYQPGTSLHKGFDTDFGLDIQWDIDLLHGYPYEFLLRNRADYTLLEQLKTFPRLIRWSFKELRTPLLLVGWFAETVWLLWLVRILLGLPVVVLSETTPLSFKATQKPGWRNALLGWLLRRSTACLYIGKRNYHFYQDMQVAHDRLFQVPYSIDNNRFQMEFDSQIVKREEICQRFGLNPTMPTFLFCGKIINKKRPLELFQAYLEAGLEQRAQLVYIGEGNLKSELEQHIINANASHVHLLGFFNQLQMPTAYVIGEILCLISDPTETWGLVVNEAFACGRPAIVSDTVGCSEDLVIPGETGWIVPLDNKPSLAATLREAYENYSKWPHMGDLARQKIGSHTYSMMVAGIKSALSSYSK